MSDDDSEATTGRDVTGDLTEPAAAARERFLAAVEAVRPRLHRFLARMTGSVFDGEDLLQDTLADAFFKLGGLRDERTLEPWLFRIAHNKAIDFVRRRDVAAAALAGLRDDTTGNEAEDAVSTTPDSELDDAQEVSAALAVLITQLPPKERACLILKDVLGHPLEDIADIADTTVGGAKAALHRARTKLRALETAEHSASVPRADLDLLRAYVECFNAHDWDGAGRLLGADARLELVGRIEGRGADFITSTYFHNYEAISWPWRFALHEVDGEPIAMMFKQVDGAWVRHAGFRVRWQDRRIAEIRDYIYVPYLYDSALTTTTLD